MNLNSILRKAIYSIRHISEHKVLWAFKWYIKILCSFRLWNKHILSLKRVHKLVMFCIFEVKSRTAKNFSDKVIVLYLFPSEQGISNFQKVPLCVCVFNDVHNWICESPFIVLSCVKHDILCCIMGAKWSTYSCRLLLNCGNHDSKYYNLFIAEFFWSTQPENRKKLTVKELNCIEKLGLHLIRCKCINKLLTN